MLKEKLLEDLKTAMRDKNVNQKNTVQMVRAAILQVEKDKHIELNDDQILEVIAKEFKKRNDSLADYEKSGREDLINQIKEEMSILEGYLPKKLSEEEITEQVKQIISEVGATSMKEMGIVMKTAKERFGITADGKTVNEIVKKLLAQKITNKLYITKLYIYLKKLKIEIVQFSVFYYSKIFAKRLIHHKLATPTKI